MKTIAGYTSPTEYIPQNEDEYEMLNTPPEELEEPPFEGCECAACQVSRTLLSPTD